MITACAVHIYFNQAQSHIFFVMQMIIRIESTVRCLCAELGTVADKTNAASVQLPYPTRIKLSTNQLQISSQFRQRSIGFPAVVSARKAP